MRLRSFATVAAVVAPVALMGCSMFGGGQKEAAAPAPAPAPVTAPTPPPAPTATPEQNQADQSLVRQVQTMLKHDHEYRGRIDGRWGPMTERGVRQFQHAHNVPVTGQLDDATMSAMNLQPSSGNGMSGSSGSNMNEPGAGSGADTGTTGNGMTQ